MTIPIISGPYRTFRRLIPGESFLEFEGSTITIPMKGRRSASDPWIEEEIKLKAFMRLEIFPAYKNNLGTREFQFIIRDWYLYGKSVMLNRLFFNDPRGFDLGSVPTKKTATDDFVPAVVTFNVSNNYRPKCDAHVPNEFTDVFGEVDLLEIRNLTSHDLRSWVDLPEKSANETYALEQHAIYWQIIDLQSLKDDDVSALFGGQAAEIGIVFHKKPLSAAGKGFNILSSNDRRNYLLAICPVQDDPKGDGVRFVARAPSNRLEACRVQLQGNTVLSAIDRARTPIEIHWAFGKGVDFRSLRTLISDSAKNKNTDRGESPLSGRIRIVSPSRSLGTADQAPDVGHPSDSADFPARITYAINYDISINKERFVEDNAGIAIAVGADDVPPRDVTVAFDKPHIGHVLQSYLEFGSGHCTGMHEIPIDAFEAGCNFCRYWQNMPLDPTDTKGWADFEDYDPRKNY